MSIKKSTTNGSSLHALRQEFRAARQRQNATLQAQLAELQEFDQRIAWLLKELETQIAGRCDRCMAFMAEKGGSSWRKAASSK